MSKLRDTELVTAIAQIVLSAVFLVGYFAILAAFLSGYATPPDEWKEVISTLLSLCTGGVLMILQFWFLRMRGQNTPAPDPAVDSPAPPQ